jgi:hypothetical protein
MPLLSSEYLMYNGCTHECTNIFPHFYMSVTPRLLPDHGSFGATPKVVLKSQSQFRKRMESQAIRFFTTEWNSWLPFGLRTLGAFVNANPKDLVFVENATSGTFIECFFVGSNDRLIWYFIN